MGVLEYANSFQGAYLLRRGLHLPYELARLVDPEILHEGLRRLKPLGQLAKMLEPDPGSDVARVCALESAHYMRNQLLRDADWAGMAHSVEIRVPLVDRILLRSLAPGLGSLSPGKGKEALARAPSRGLPQEVIDRAKTGFAVPTGAWMDGFAEQAIGAAASRAEIKGLQSRRWSRVVLAKGHKKTEEARAA